MAMCRLPTTVSDGRANLHQGAIGAGIDIASGRASFTPRFHNRTVTHHIDTHAPIVGFLVPGWDNVLDLAVRAAEISGLGYVGVDVVIDEEHGPLLLELNARPGPRHPARQQRGPAAPPALAARRRRGAAARRALSRHGASACASPAASCF